MSNFWERVVLAAVMILVAGAVANLVDRRISRREYSPETVTRYRVLRRSIFTSIIVVGVLSALLVIPAIRAFAGGILASGAVIGIIVGFAAQRTIGNFVAGLLIAFTQPVRIGDEVEVQGAKGVVEEIGLTYTWIRTRDNDQLVVPNEKLASDTIRNSTIRNPETLAEVTVQVPLSSDLRAIVEALRQESDDVFVTDLSGNATITVRKAAPHQRAAERVESELRLAVHDRLRAVGAFA